MKKEIKLTDLEMKIMRVLWEHEKNLTIQEISGYLTEEKISTASVSQSVKNLLKKKAAAVCEYVPAANVYARTFCPCFSREEFLAIQFRQLERNVMSAGKRDLKGIVAALLNSSEGKQISIAEIEELQQIMEE